MTRQAQRSLGTALSMLLMVGMAIWQTFTPTPATARPLGPAGTLADAFEDQVATCVLVMASDGKYEYDFKKFLQACEEVVKQTNPELYASHSGSTVQAEKLKAIAPTCGLLLGVGYGVLVDVQARITEAQNAADALPAGPARSSAQMEAYNLGQRLNDAGDRREVIDNAIAGSLPANVTLNDVHLACSAAFEQLNEVELTTRANLVNQDDTDVSRGRLFDPSCPAKHSSAPLHSGEVSADVSAWFLLASASPRNPATAAFDEIGGAWGDVFASVSDWCDCGGGNMGNSNKEKDKEKDKDDKEEKKDAEEKKRDEEAKDKQDAEHKRDEEESKIKPEDLIENPPLTAGGC